MAMDLLDGLTHCPEFILKISQEQQISKFIATHYIAVVLKKVNMQ